MAASRCYGYHIRRLEHITSYNITTPSTVVVVVVVLVVVCVSIYGGWGGGGSRRSVHLLDVYI